SPHGKKLFYLWSSDRDAYANLRRSKLAIPVGFTIVKQSFAAVGDASSGYTTGAKKDLFVMTKIGGDKSGSDDGWIYGTVTPDGVVTSAGRVETCMHCHDDQATHERLFGIADL
ncbi:MAG TPA: cytochrome P460 family protein, partial [Kofleriaceae bacterium]|nr:cytochrome P460 family protein [Kofleriaceae bacterium]